MKKKILLCLIIIILFICNGCGSLMMIELRFIPLMLPSDKKIDTKLDLYPATRSDFRWLYFGSENFITDPTFLLIFGPYYILDLPIAISTDTILFPYDFYKSKHYREEDKDKEKIEYSSVVEYIKNNKEVIEKVNGIKDVKLSMTTGRPNVDLPDRYVLSVYGLDKKPREKDFKTVHVVIDVSRKEGVARFKLRCFTSDPHDADCNESE